MTFPERLVSRLRPAPLASAVASLLGLNRRQILRTAGVNLYINPVSSLGSQMLQGEYEPETRRILQKHLSSGGVFIDLGANEGYFSIIAAKIVGAQGRVLAIEPQSRLQSVIRQNIEANGCRNITVVRSVISSVGGSVTIHLADERNNGSTSLFRMTKYPLRREEVPSVTLGEFLQQMNVDHCDLLKMDIEGAEYDVIVGAKDVLMTGVIRNVAVEIHESILERIGRSSDQLHQLMLDCGYQLRSESGMRVYSHR